MRTKKPLVILLALVYLVVNVIPVFAAAPKFGIDDQNTRQIKDSFAQMEFPFFEKWANDLQGKVMSQPIIVNGYIYVQAGTDLVKVKLEDGQIVGRIKVSNHELPSGSSPTYAETTHNPRIYQATRDHLLWAVDVNTFQLAWEQPFIITTQELEYSDKNRYRITASPLVFIKDNKTFIALGSANGDKTGKPVQHADNGFFIIHDYGSKGKLAYKSRMKQGEVTGSSAMQNNGMIIGTINTQDKESHLIRYLLDKGKFASLAFPVDCGVPGSPAIENEDIYVADRTSTIYKYKNTSEMDIKEQWKNPERPGDFDAGRALNSYNLMSPTIGSKYIYLPVQHYNSYSTSGSGAIIAVDKVTGYTHKICPFSSKIAYNPTFPQSHPTNNATLKSNLLYWKPFPDKDQDYLFVFDSKGKAWVLDGETLETVNWFYDKTAKKAVASAQLFEVTDETSPEMVIADSHLIVVDGAGVMRTYMGKRPINFTAHELKPVIDKEYKPGEEVEFNFTVENTSEKEYAVPIILITPANETIDFGKVDLKSGQKVTVTLPQKFIVPRRGSTYQAIVNPENHPDEITAEIKPRTDNIAVHELNKRINDLEIVSLTLPRETATEKAVTIKTIIKNGSTKEVKNVLVKWMVDAKEIRQETLNFAQGESKTIKFTWRAPKQAAIVNIAAIVDPERTLDEENYENNFMHKYITVNKFIPRSCNDKLEKANWTVTYWVKNADGTSTPVSVTYHESLVAEATINTKQGIPTDPKKPKKSDRESRGSWEIIPYAEELSRRLHKKVDPNEITRAGYGFELTMETNYWNDWEEKIPSGASAIGGTFNGPTQVVLEIYDTTGRPIKEIGMEKLPDSAKGKGKAVWVLPYLPPYKFQTGEVVYERKHYTSPETKDGNYRLVIRVEYAGRNGLYTCLEKNVIIWGSMYDDIITMPVPKGYDGDYLP